MVAYQRSRSSSEDCGSWMYGPHRSGQTELHRSQKFAVVPAVRSFAQGLQVSLALHCLHCIALYGIILNCTTLRWIAFTCCKTFSMACITFVSRFSSSCSYYSLAQDRECFVHVYVSWAASAMRGEVELELEVGRWLELERSWSGPKVSSRKRNGRKSWKLEFGKKG